MYRKLLPAWFAASLLTATAAFGVTVAGTDANAAGVLSLPGGIYDGVALLRFSAGDCSGALIGAYSVLTAAHCVTNNAGVANVDFLHNDAVFDLLGGPVSVGFASVAVAPGWAGLSSGNLSNDLAILTLSAIAPTSEIYSIYSGAPGSALGATFTLVGYGYGGTGVSGYDTGATSCALSTDALRCKRSAQNVYDGTILLGPNKILDGGLKAGYTDYVYDLDDGTLTANALGGLDLALGTNEGLISPGDSGGPSFIGNQIAGVHSFTTCFVAQPAFPGGKGSCVTNPASVRSVFGDVAADTEVAQYSGWIAAQLAPEPGTWITVLAGLTLCCRRKKL